MKPSKREKLINEMYRDWILPYRRTKTKTMLKQINTLQTYNRFYVEKGKPKKVAYLDKKEVIKLIKQWNKNLKKT